MATPVETKWQFLRRNKLVLRYCYYRVKKYLHLVWQKTSGWSTNWVVRQQQLARVYRRSLRRKLASVRYSLSRQIRVRSRVVWRDIRRSRGGHPALRALLGIGVLIALWYPAERFGQGALEWVRSGWQVPSWIRSIPVELVWWALGIGLVITILVWLARQGQTGTGTATWRFPRTATVVVVLVVLVVLLTPRVRAWFDGGIAVDSGWSKVIRVPPGKQVVWERRHNVAYQIMTQSGRVYNFDRDPEEDTRTACERHVWIPEAATSFQIRVNDKEREETIFDLTFSPYVVDGPCGASPPPALEEEPDPIPPAEDFKV